MGQDDKILEVGEERKDDKGTYSKLHVMQSGAGFYIGRIYTQNDGFQEPGSRESDYYPTHELATEALKSGDFNRDCFENQFMYTNTTVILSDKQD